VRERVVRRRPPCRLRHGGAGLAKSALMAERCGLGTPGESRGGAAKSAKRVREELAVGQAAMVVWGGTGGGGGARGEYLNGAI